MIHIHAACVWDVLLDDLLADVDRDSLDRDVVDAVETKLMTPLSWELKPDDRAWWWKWWSDATH